MLLVYRRHIACNEGLEGRHIHWDEVVWPKLTMTEKNI